MAAIYIPRIVPEPEPPIDFAHRIAAIAPRGACSDGERRAAVLLRDELRRRGRPSRLETAWVRPGWPLVYALACAVGVVGSLLAPSQPWLGLALALVALVALTGEVSGLAPVARLLTPRRVTQCVVSEPAPSTADVRVRLIVTAALDAGRTGLVYRLAPLEARARRALRGHLSSPPALLCAALALVTALAAVRVAGVDGGWLGPVALVPTIALVLGVGACLDIALAAPSPGANAHASAVAAALELVAQLDRDPPHHLAVELVLAGAGEGGQLGLRAYVRHRRRRARPHELAVLALGPCGAGTPRFHVTEGLLVPARMHPELVALAGGIECAAPIRRQVSGAIIARRAGWPAIGLSALDAGDRPGAAHTVADDVADLRSASIAQTITCGLALVRTLDRQL